MIPTVHALNSKFAHKGNIFFNKKGEHIIAKIDNKFACCAISLYGAQVLSYEPQGEENVLWMSKKSHFEAGKAIRGGIPVCFPWFGPHNTDSSKPQHGFARIVNWVPEQVSTLQDGATQLVLVCTSNEETMKLWPFNFEAKIIVTIGEALEVALEVENKDKDAFEYTDAFHSYFYISKPENISISGLKDASYYDVLENESQKIQHEELLIINKEENRRYIGHSDTCIIYDEGLNRKIEVQKHNSKTTIVWNPWETTTLKTEDMEPNGYKTMVCIEAANAYNDFVLIKPGEKFRMSTIIKSVKI